MKPRVRNNEVNGSERVISDASVDLIDELGGEFSQKELDDFLAADVLEVQADPAFRERLRKKLWTMVSDRYGRGSNRKG